MPTTISRSRQRSGTGCWRAGFWSTSRRTSTPTRFRPHKETRMANGPGTATHVPVVIPVVRGDATTPPKTPWQAALSRALAGVAVIAPIVLMFVIDPLVDYVSKQAIVLPDAYKQWQPVIGIVLSGLVLSWQALRKQQKESARLQAARELGLTDA